MLRYTANALVRKPLFRMTRCTFATSNAPSGFTQPNDPNIDYFAGEVVKAREAEIREQHHRVRESYPESAQPPAGQGERVDANIAHRKRLIYRAKQRGWLEVDLLLGSWAEDNVKQLSDGDLKQFEDILNLETLDIFNIITKQMEPPSHVQGDVLRRIQDFVITSPAGVADPEGYAQIKSKMSN